MAESDEGFPARWSRRKRATQAKEPAGTPEPAPPAAGREPAEDRPAELPDPDTLDADGDFTVFLKDNVPEAIRRRALRRLWRLNPVLANLDGLNDYDDDYTDAATVVEGLKTLYKVGKGFVEDEDEGEEKGEDGAAPGLEDEAETAAEDSDGDSDGPPGEAGQIAALPGGEAGAEPLGSTLEPALESGPRSGLAPAAERAGPSVASGPKKRRRGALARRWGKFDD